MTDPTAFSVSDDAEQLRADITVLGAMLDAAVESQADQSLIEAVGDILGDRRAQLEQIDERQRATTDSRRPAS